MPYGILAADLITTSTAGGTLGAGNATNFKNRIINGAMMIDQRNAGASVTITNTSDVTYTLDRWLVFGTAASKFSVQQNAGSVTPPTGFINYLGITSLSAYSIVSDSVFQLTHRVEGLNCADLGWGTANAKTVTLSFLVYSSLTGTFGGSLRNSAANRSYPFTYTISSANTWNQINLTIAGDTTGTWLTNNGIGISVTFGLGAGSILSGTAGSWASANYATATGATSVVGTNGATFYITGVQLEVGASASSFEVRDYGRELVMCQRYYQKSYNYSAVPGSVDQAGAYMCPYMPAGNAIRGTIFYKTSMRSAPTVTTYNPETGTSGYWCFEGSGATNQAAAGVTFISDNGALIYTTSAVAGIAYIQWKAEIEL